MSAYCLSCGWASVTRTTRGLLPGLTIALTVAAAANFVAMVYGGPVMLLALLIGMALNFLSAVPAAGAGLRFAAKPVLQVGVALLGLRISFAQVVGLGFGTLVLVFAGVVVAIGAGVLVARLTRQGVSFGLLAGGATGICGASAALAIASALPHSDARQRQTTFVIVTVTTLSTIAMVVYPVLAYWLGFDDRTTGIFLGATIHDVAQVVGAGYAVSTTAGDTATVVKLVRVALLLPTVVAISAFALHPTPRSGGRAALVPSFAVAFAVGIAINSFGLVPAGLAPPLIEFSRWCLVVAVASIGIRTSIPEVFAVGRLSLAAPLVATLVLLGLTTSILVLGPMTPAGGR